MWELTILYPYGRAHNQRWGIRDGFIYPVADPRLVLDTKVRCLCHGDGGEIKLAHEQHVGGQWLVSYITYRRTEDYDLQQWYLEPFEGDY